MRLSILIPTHNRPQLLREALASVAAQTRPNWDVVVVDDGSREPVSAESIREVVGDRFRLLRHESPKGIAATKNAAVAAAEGDVLLHLDDDDLLDGRAVETILGAFDRRPELDCLFVNVTAFGQIGEYARDTHKAALAKVLAVAEGRDDGDLLVFDRRLVLGLLLSVPWAFQRPAARRSAWRDVGMLPLDVSLPEPEWALYAAMKCRAALLRPELYRVRADRQGTESQGRRQRSHIESVIVSRRRFVEFLDRQPKGEVPREIVRGARSALANALESKAYYYTREELEPALAAQAAVRAFLERPSLIPLRLLAKSALVAVGRRR